MRWGKWKYDWHDWYAWYPIHINGEWVWRETVERKLHDLVWDEFYKYRLKNGTERPF